MNKNFYLNFIATLMLIALIFFGITIVNVFDRLRLEQENNRKAIDELRKYLQSAPAQIVERTVEPQAKTASPAADIANREFFEPQAVPGDRIIYTIMADTGNMNYMINNDSTVSEFYGICNSSLAERNYAKPELYQPVMAESWTRSEDNLVYTIKLRKGILWHDFTDPVNGKKWEDVEVTAHDFKFYVDVIKNPQTNCAPLRTYLQNLDRIEVINDYEFKVVWTSPYFLSESWSLGLPPLPRHLYHAYEGPFDPLRFNDDHQRNRMIVGCGPYRFVRWDKDSRVIFTRWEKYFGNELGIAPPIKDICYDVIKMPNTRFQALISGKVDWMGLTPEQWHARTDVPAFGENGILKKHRYLNRVYSYIGYNQQNPLFQDRRVRQALTHLVNRDRILKDIYYGLGRVVTGPFYYESPYNDLSIKPWPFDVVKAKQLLAEAGWKDTDGDGIVDKGGIKFEFTIMEVANHPIQTRMLPLIKEDMAKAGIDMKIQSFEWSVYIQRLEQKKFDACTLGWSSPYESDPYQIWHSSEADKPASSNHIGFRSKEADKLIEAMRVEFDFDKRIKLAHQFQQLLHDEQPYTFLVASDSLVAIASRYQNVRLFPLGIPSTIVWTPASEQLTIP